MVNDGAKDWQDLCKAAAREMDPNKLMTLVSEINRALEEREKRRPWYPEPERPSLTESV